MFSQPLKMDKYELDTEISIGVSFSKDEPSTERLIRRAETAIYLTKRGKNKYRYYSPDLDIPIYKYFTLRNDLRKSIENNQLRFYYQPFINLGPTRYWVPKSCPVGAPGMGSRISLSSSP